MGSDITDVHLAKAPALYYYRATVEYDGTDFYGVQAQPAKRTVSSDLERAFSVVLRRYVTLVFAGRTDSGVHATGQVASFSTDRPIEDCARVEAELNRHLADDIKVRDICPLQRRFSARHDASDRTYLYVLNRSERPSPLSRRFSYTVGDDFDVYRAKAAATHLIGRHDFALFGMFDPSVTTTTRTIYECEVQESAELVFVQIVGSGFLRNMVRNIVGSLVEVAQGHRDPDLSSLLHGRQRGLRCGPRLPAHALILAGVRYAEYDSFRSPEFLGVPWPLLERQRLAAVDVA